MAISSCSYATTVAVNQFRIPTCGTFRGAVERNEDPLNAIIREIEEEFEIKLQLRDCKELWKYTHDHAAIDHVFLCKVPANAMPILHEGAAWAWMTLDEIEKLKLGFDQGKIIAYIARTRPTEEG
jgi:8-oxo-dGTP pyrophosphatase MutT (NUDIX family)